MTTLSFAIYILIITMIFAVAKKNENNEKLMRRFKKQVQKAGIVKLGRIGRYFKKAKTQVRVRQEAIQRTKNRAKKRERILWN